MSDFTHKEVAIRANVHPKDALFMRSEVGSAEDQDGGQYEMSAGFGSMAPIVRVPDGRWVVFPWDALVAAAHEAVCSQQEDAMPKDHESYLSPLAAQERARLLTAVLRAMGGDGQFQEMVAAVKECPEEVQQCLLDGLIEGADIEVEREDPMQSKEVGSGSEPITFLDEDGEEPSEDKE